MHTGEALRARLLAAMNFDLFDEHVECIITNAAGCGSAMKEYELLFHDHELEEKAKRFSSRIQDISQFLSQQPLEPFLSSGAAVRIAYHDACHLAHAQGIAAEPRQLLSSIPGVEVVEIPDGEICCGSAGTYNIEQPDIARELGNRKAKNIHDLKVDAVVTGNIGCMVQLRKHLAEIDSKRPLPVMHTVEFLEQAYNGKFAERFGR
jgi:glycolate oxidase iron-sulfur subunit